MREAESADSADGEASLHGHAEDNSKGSGKEKVQLQFGSFVKPDDAGVASPVLLMHKTNESDYTLHDFKASKNTFHSHMYVYDRLSLIHDTPLGTVGVCKTSMCQDDYVSQESKFPMETRQLERKPRQRSSSQRMSEFGLILN